VAVVLNFEARGNAGPVILFETGAEDAAWIEAYARAVRTPQASSLGPAVYERLPNDTDFSVFKAHGLAGLNFAFIGGGSAYHQPWDTPENLDRSSLQHQGEIVLGLARHLGQMDREELHAGDGHATFFTLPGNVLVHYPRTWEPALALLAALATAGAIAFGVRAGVLRLPGTLLATLAFPALAAAVGAVLVGLAWAVSRASSAAFSCLNENNW